MKAQKGDRVRVHRKHTYGEGEGRWGTVVERQGKTRMLVVFDEDRGRCKLGVGKRTSVHDSEVASVAMMLRPLNLVEDRTLEQRIADGEPDATPQPSTDQGEKR